MISKIKEIVSSARHFLELMVGVPSYKKYVEHLSSQNPKQEIPSRKDFFDKAQKKRYLSEDGNVSKCC